MEELYIKSIFQQLQRQEQEQHQEDDENERRERKGNQEIIANM